MAIGGYEAFRQVIKEHLDMCGVGIGGGPPNFSPAYLKALQLSATQFQHRISQAQAQAAAMGLQPGGIIPFGGLGGLAASVPAAPHEKWTKKSEQIVAGEIIGYRAWSVSVTTGELRSVAANYTWEPKKVAEGKPLEGYGIHAYKTPHMAVHDQYGSAVYGTIAMWGDVIEHEEGYRSQYARVVSLDHFGAHIDVHTREELKRLYL